MEMVTTHRLRQADIDFQANLYVDANPTRRHLHLTRRTWVEAALASHLPPQGSALEIGVGCGVFVRYLSALGAQVTALDINPTFLAGVRRVANVQTILEDATVLHSLPDCYDLALCSEVLEHIPSADAPKVLALLHSVLKPDGCLILTTPQRFSTVEMTARLLKFKLFRGIARCFYRCVDELGHINLVTSRQLQDQIEKAGFVIEAQTRMGFYLPVVGELGGQAGYRLLTWIERQILQRPLLKNLLWTQAYILRRKGT